MPGKAARRRSAAGLIAACACLLAGCGATMAVAPGERGTGLTETVDGSVDDARRAADAMLRKLATMQSHATFHGTTHRTDVSDLGDMIVFTEMVHVSNSDSTSRYKVLLGASPASGKARVEFICEIDHRWADNAMPESLGDMCPKMRQDHRGYETVRYFMCAASPAAAVKTTYRRLCESGMYEALVKQLRTDAAASAGDSGPQEQRAEAAAPAKAKPAETPWWQQK